MRRGIGMRLVELSIALGRVEGADAITTTATALRSQRLFQRVGLLLLGLVALGMEKERGMQLGFETLREVAYDEYKKDGARVFESLHDGATSGKLMLLRLNQPPP